MHFDKAPRRQAVIVDTPAGVVYELDVYLTAVEIAVVTEGRLMPSPRKAYEPWLRLTCDVGGVVTRAGIEIVDEDDGA